MARIQILHGETGAPTQQTQITFMALGRAHFAAPVPHWSSNSLDINPKHKCTNICGFVLHKSF